jgi:predicted secreted Zn-dependent protease
MPEPIENHVNNALVAAQKLEKFLRNLRNRDEAKDAEVSLAKDAVAVLRQIAAIRGIRPMDIDSRGARNK